MYMRSCVERINISVNNSVYNYTSKKDRIICGIQLKMT
ncbi:MAG: hypothetical protein ACI9FY_000506, partial [Patiriisocius sp.]